MSQQQLSVLCESETESKRMIFPDDMVFLQCQFLDTKFVLGVVVLVSKQWYRVAQLVPLHITMNAITTLINQDRIERMFRHEMISNLVHLELSWVNRKIKLFPMFSSPYLKNLTRLKMEGFISNEDVLALKNSVIMERLTVLNLSNNYIDSSGAAIISQMTQLKELKLNGNIIEDEGVKDIAQRLYLSKLCVSNCEISSEGAFKIASSLLLKNLHFLDIGSNCIMKEGCRAIVTSNRLSLHTLRVGNNCIGKEGCDSISHSKTMAHLTHLDIQTNEIGIEGVESLSTSVYLRNLTYLNLTLNGIGNKGVQWIVNSPNMEQLTELHLANNDITNEGISHVTNSSCLSKLKHLNLQSNLITDQGARYFFTTKCLSSLETLDLYYNRISHVSADEVVKNLTKLKHVYGLLLNN